MTKTFEHAGHKIEIRYDDEPPHPRRDWDAFGTMLCFHKRYDLGDKDVPSISPDDFGSWDEMEEHLIAEEKAEIILPLSLFDHSGISISVGVHRGWDSGQVGFIYVTKDQILKNFMVQEMTEEIRARAEKVLRGEVETYDQFLRGLVYMFSVGDHCVGGFFDETDAENEAKAYAETL